MPEPTGTRATVIVPDDAMQSLNFIRSVTGESMVAVCARALAAWAAAELASPEFRERYAVQQAEREATAKRLGITLAP
jgi:hypothetical protein